MTVKPEDIARSRELVADGWATQDAAWLIDNCSTLLEHLTAALDEVERLQPIADALFAFEAAEAEIDAAPPEDLEPMSARSIELGGKSIAAWQRVEAAMKAARR